MKKFGASVLCALTAGVLAVTFLGAPTASFVFLVPIAFILLFVSFTVLEAVRG